MAVRSTRLRPLWIARWYPRSDCRPRSHSEPWIVSGHLRRQYYPASDAHKPLHIAPYVKRARRQAAEGTNVHFLENRAVELGGVRFLGCTLWTDFALFGEAELVRCMPTLRCLGRDRSTARRGSRYWVSSGNGTQLRGMSSARRARYCARLAR